METAIEFRRWYAWLIWNLAWKGREHVNSLRELVDIMLELAHRVEAMEQYLERRSRGRWKASDD